MDKKFYSLYLKALIPVVFILISLGGAVRAMHAGLACPDWPLCFGKIIPDYQLQVYYEFIHRVLAGAVGVATLVLTFLILFNKNIEKKFKQAILISDLILISQIIFGGLTVLKLLKFEIVTMHLMLGLAFLCSLLWLLFMFSERTESKNTPAPLSFRLVHLTVMSMLVGQIFLGGMVSTNYAGLACETFPLCRGQLIPTLEGSVGIHVMHRMWGYLTAFAFIALFQVAWKSRKELWMSKGYLKLSLNLVILILFQIGVGALNVLYKTPAVITVLHLAIATLLLATLLKGTRYLF